MPVQNLRFTFEQTGGRPEDRVVWSFGVDGPVIDNSNITPLADDFEAALQADFESGFYAAIETYLQGGLHLILAESFYAEGGEATAVEIRDYTVPGTSVGPSEVQLCVSRMGMSPRGMAPIGRIYIGPLSSSATSGGRPVPALMRSAGEFAQLFHVTNMAARGYVPVVIRNAGTVAAYGSQIDGHRVDNAWDTQRRRGWEPSDSVSIPAS